MNAHRISVLLSALCSAIVYSSLQVGSYLGARLYAQIRVFFLEVSHGKIKKV